MFLVQAKFLSQDKILGNSRISTDIIVVQELSILNSDLVAPTPPPPPVYAENEDKIAAI